MRCLVMILYLAVVLFSAAPAHSFQEGCIEVTVVSDYGGELKRIPFREHGKGGTRVVKMYVEATKGENYSIVLRSNRTERLGAVVAVDGRNIISGKKSDLGRDEAMYIIDPHGSIRLEGWRTDQNTVHRFYFTDVQDSYAVRTFSDTSAMGVIAVAVYQEKPKPEMLREGGMKRDRESGPSPAVPERAESLEAGTGFGDEKHSPAIKVKFEPKRTPLEKVLIKYEWREGLCRKGIIKCPPDEKNRLWDEEGEYAPHPPGYRQR